MTATVAFYDLRNRCWLAIPKAAVTAIAVACERGVNRGGYNYFLTAQNAQGKTMRTKITEAEYKEWEG